MISENSEIIDFKPKNTNADNGNLQKLKNIGQADVPPPPAPQKPQDEGPSMLELMMEAQKAAQAEKSIKQEKEKNDFNAKGFKKGFFGNANDRSQKESKQAKVDIPTIQKKVENKRVIEEVQTALEEDQSPILKELRKNEWMTNDLMSKFQGSKTLWQGFQNKKCMAAMQLLQSNPKEAAAKFKDDPEVSAFVQEFGKLMGDHFEALGKQQSNQNNTNSVSSGPVIQEIGPLHAKALKQQQNTVAAPSNSVTNNNSKITTIEPIKKSAANSTSNSSSNGNNSSSNNKSTKEAADEQARVEKILQDPELREMLMDPKLQQILVECNDPVKYRQHMQNPEIVRKLKKLHESGLVQTTK